ncbi:MAG: GNAT family N-acetyltransferase [Streptosporangiaceae bacterium]|nr:GNAT family N-acetyltransferase [Streptosporangiaceae bacterium]
MPTDDLVLRRLTPADMPQVEELDTLVFLEEASSEAERVLYEEITGLDLGRGIGVFDGTELAGVGTIAALEMSVPGGLLPMAGVLIIGVKPTHRRRGIMTRMIRHQLRELHEEGLEPVAGLTASESVIYGRFGYGQASYGGYFAVPRERSALRPVAGIDDVRIRLVPTADSVAVCEQIHARQVGKRPGMLVRPEPWGRWYAADFDRRRAGRSAKRTVLAERGGERVGYARYRTRDETGANGVATGYTDIEEIHADDAAAFAALSRYLLGIDLTGGARFWRQPVDSPLMYLLEDLRAADMRVREVLYLRLVDVDRALAGRVYAHPIDLVLEVTDGLCPWNAGRWRLTGDEKTAQCVPTDASADLVIDVRELAAVYLGGTTFAALEQAALVTESRPGAVLDASRAFATPLAPWLQFGI